MEEEGSEKIDGMIESWGRWSDTVDVKFPQKASFDTWLENILSIRVLEWQVGHKISGKIMLEKRESKNSFAWGKSYFNKSMLKSPSKK